CGCGVSFVEVFVRFMKNRFTIEYSNWLVRAIVSTSSKRGTCAKLLRPSILLYVMYGSITCVNFREPSGFRYVLPKTGGRKSIASSEYVLTRSVGTTRG